MQPWGALSTGEQGISEGVGEGAEDEKGVDEEAREGGVGEEAEEGGIGEEAKEGGIGEDAEDGVEKASVKVPKWMSKGGWGW
jgi:hypothetical protein